MSHWRTNDSSRVECAATFGNALEPESQRMTRLRDKLTLPSRLRYLIWRTGALGREVTVQLTSGEWFILSGFTYESNVAYEIFVNEAYRFPRPSDCAAIKTIVDVGANVGYSIIYWASHFPEARIEAFEPHPAHLDRLRRSVALNCLDDRVTIYAQAVGTASGMAQLADAGVASAVVAEGRTSAATGNRAVPIEVVDFFEVLGSTRIDLLKLDCEGAEFDLLMDPRFARLDVRNLVMEWHETPAHPMAELELSERLRKLGWKLELRPESVSGPVDGTDLLRVGILWAFSPSIRRDDRPNSLFVT
jgi:FkbM family methyltransferase